MDPIAEIISVDVTKLPWPASPREQILDALRLLLDGSLTKGGSARRAAGDARQGLRKTRVFGKRPGVAPCG